MTQALWWTIAGWEIGTEPGSYRVGWDAAESTEWREAFVSAGYYLLGRWTLNVPQYEDELEVWRHTGGNNHLLVMFGGNERFFVNALYSPAFWADKFPALLQLGTCDRQTTAVEQLAKAVLGYVRHGRGEHVIDELGTESLEERQRRIEEMRRRRDAAGRSAQVAGQ